MQKTSKPAPAQTPKPKSATKATAPRVASRKCAICGAEVAPISEEALCWVCRRLKVSAWSEGTDNQMFAAE